MLRVRIPSSAPIPDDSRITMKNPACRETVREQCSTSIKGESIVKNSNIDSFLDKTTAILEQIESTRLTLAQSQHIVEKEYDTIASVDPILAALIKEADVSADAHREAIRRRILQLSPFSSRRPN